MQKILVVCTGNTCRSPMTQHLLKKILGECRTSNTVVLSAGLAACDGIPASEGALNAMRMEGIDLSGHRSQRLCPEMVSEADIILTMTAEHRLYLKEMFPEWAGHIYTLGEFAGEGETEILDPFGRGTEAYLKSLQQIKNLVVKIAARIAHADDEE